MKAPYRAIEYIIENSCKYAEAKAQRIYLEEFRKTKKALLMKDALARGIDSAVADGNLGAGAQTGDINFVSDGGSITLTVNWTLS